MKTNTKAATLIAAVMLLATFPALAQKRGLSSTGQETYTLRNGQQVPARDRNGVEGKPDGKGGVSYADGTNVSVGRNGHTVLRSADGRVREYTVDGNEIRGGTVMPRESTASDGTATYTLGNGQQVPRESPGGDAGKINADGSVAWADGTQARVDKNGYTVISRGGKTLSVTDSAGNPVTGVYGIPAATKPGSGASGGAFGKGDAWAKGQIGKPGKPVDGKYVDPGAGSGKKPDSSAYKPSSGGMGSGKKPDGSSSGSGGSGKKPDNASSGSGSSGKKPDNASSGGKPSSGGKDSGKDGDKGGGKDGGKDEGGSKDKDPSGDKGTGKDTTDDKGKGGDKNVGLGGTGSGGGARPGKAGVDARISAMRGEGRQAEDGGPDTCSGGNSRGGGAVQPGSEQNCVPAGAARPLTPGNAGPKVTLKETGTSTVRGNSVINPKGKKTTAPEGQSLEDGLKDLESVTNPGRP